MSSKTRRKARKKTRRKSLSSTSTTSTQYADAESSTEIVTSSSSSSSSTSSLGLTFLKSGNFRVPPKSVRVLGLESTSWSRSPRERARSPPSSDISSVLPSRRRLGRSQENEKIGRRSAPRRNSMVVAERLRAVKSVFRSKHAKVKLTGELSLAGQSLHEAVLMSDVARVQQMLAAGAPLNEADEMGKTVLNNALKLSTPQTVHAILQTRHAEMYINLQDKYGFAPLHFAVRGARSDRVMRYVTRLLAFETLQLNIANKSGNTPLLCFLESYAGADMTMLAKMLIERGADASVRNVLGETVLHKCVLNKLVPFKTLADTVALLLDYDVAVDARNDSGETALHYACHTNRTELALPLLRIGVPLRAENDAADRSVIELCRTTHNTQMERAITLFATRSLSVASFSLFGVTAMDRVAASTWWTIAQYAGGAQTLIAVCRRFVQLLRPMIRAVTVRRGIERRDLSELLSINSVRERWPHMRELQLHCCEAVTENTLVDVSRMQIEVLSLAGAGQVSGTTCRRLARMEALASVDLSYCELIDNNAVGHFANLASLRVLALGGTKFVSVDGLLTLVSGAPQLESLDLRYSNISDICVSMLSKKANQLRHLSLMGCRELTSRALLRLGRFTALESLNLSVLKCVVASSFQEIGKLRKLTLLNLSYCPELRPSDVQTFLETADGALQTLVLDGCKLFDALSVRRLRDLVVLLDDTGDQGCEIHAFHVDVLYKPMTLSDAGAPPAPPPAHLLYDEKKSAPSLSTHSSMSSSLNSALSRGTSESIEEESELDFDLDEEIDSILSKSMAWKKSPMRAASSKTIRRRSGVYERVANDSSRQRSNSSSEVLRKHASGSGSSKQRARLRQSSDHFKSTSSSWKYSRDSFTMIAGGDKFDEREEEALRESQTGMRN